MIKARQPLTGSKADQLLRSARQAGNCCLRLRLCRCCIIFSSSSVQGRKEGRNKETKGAWLSSPCLSSSSAANSLLVFWRCPRKGKELVAPAAKIWPGCLSWPQASLHDRLLKTLVVATYMAENENLPPKVIKELAKEIKSLDETPPDGIRVVVNEDTFSTIFADIEGPAGTPYEGGVFRMKLVLTSDFPNSAPKGYFLTKIFHPNISTNGEICVNTLKKDWRPNLGLRHIFLVVRCLLVEPFPESALNEQAGKLLMEDYEEYSRHARLYTSLHAMKSKLKNKVNISENAALAEGPKNAVVTPLAPCLTNKDNTCQGQSTTVASAEAIGVDISAVQKKKDVGSTKVQVDKKKLDARKKSLKRL